MAFARTENNIRWTPITILLRRNLSLILNFDQEICEELCGPIFRIVEVVFVLFILLFRQREKAHLFRAPVQRKFPVSWVNFGSEKKC